MPHAGWGRGAYVRLIAAATLALAAPGAGALDAHDLKGRTITIYAGGEPGGYDVYARLLMNHYPRHIPGNPAMTLKQMPGAGTLRAANYLYEAAPRDGTAIGTAGGDMASAALLKARGARFDPRRFVWIGSMTSEVGLVLAWSAVPVRTIEDVFHRELLVGGCGPASGDVVFPTVMNAVLGTRFRIIPGYGNAADVALAIERREIEGTANGRYSAIAARHPDWLAAGKVRVLLQDSLRPHRRYPDVPVVGDLAKTDEQRAILDLVFSRQELGRPFMLPPDTPPAIGAALRRAFDATMADPALLAKAAAAKLDLDNPMTGGDIDALIARLYAIPPGVVVKAREATGETTEGQ